MHAAITVAVGDIQIALRSDREIGGEVVRASRARDAAIIEAHGPRFAWRSGGTQGPQQFAVERELAHGVTEVVRAP